MTELNEKIIQFWNRDKIFNNKTAVIAIWENKDKKWNKNLD